MLHRRRAVSSDSSSHDSRIFYTRAAAYERQISRKDQRSVWRQGTLLGRRHTSTTPMRPRWRAGLSQLSPEVRLFCRLCSGLGRNREGATAVEFALLAPALCMLLMGIVQFGLAFNNYITLNQAVTAGGRQFSLSRGSSTPRSSTVSLVQSAAVNLTVANITITTTVNGAACSTDSACQTALSANAKQPGSVSATYPCDLTIFGTNFAPNGCTLSSSTTERIE
jgi:Flp pilus assembly protein TadG